LFSVNTLCEARLGSVTRTVSPRIVDHALTTDAEALIPCLGVGRSSGLVCAKVVNASTSAKYRSTLSPKPRRCDRLHAPGPHCFPPSSSRTVRGGPAVSMTVLDQILMVPAAPGGRVGKPGDSGALFYAIRGTGELGAATSARDIEDEHLAVLGILSASNAQQTEALLTPIARALDALSVALRP
jgi:hypothetical protein